MNHLATNPTAARRRLPAEWEPVGAVLLAWPRADGDWAPYLQEVRACYRRLLAALTPLVPVLLLVDDPERVRQELGPELAALTRKPLAWPAGTPAEPATLLEPIASTEPCDAGASAAPQPRRAGGPAGPPLRLLASPARDTWTRDYGPITVLLEPDPVAGAAAGVARAPLADPPPPRPMEAAAPPSPGPAPTAVPAPAAGPGGGPGGEAPARPLLLNFAFNGWGGKFSSEGDDAATRALHASGALGPVPLERHALVLEGGSFESDGRGTLLTTSTCLLAPSRNPQLDRAALEAELKRLLGVERVLWLQQEALAGDDTDAHIDTLVRFCPHDTLVYVGSDPLEQQLRALRTPDGRPYRLVPLPPGPPRQAPDDGRPLPATYANALLLNGTVLLPVYGDPERDAAAGAAWQQACPGWPIVAVDCSALLLQHGSLHCATMQIPAAVFRSGQPPDPPWR